MESKEFENGKNLPSESPKKEHTLSERRLSRKAEREEKRLQKDEVFRTPLTPPPEVDETAPLAKGSVDTWFLLWSMLLVCFGAVMSYSASAVYAEREYGSSTYYLWRYLLFALIACVVTVLFVMLARPWMLRYLAVGTYALSIVLLLLVLLIGAAEGVAQRWIDFGIFTLQPSEIAKMAVVMMLALYMSKYERKISSRAKYSGSFQHGFVVPMAIIGLICVLIALERHISGLMIVGVLGVSVMFLGGTRPKYLGLFFGIIFVAGVFLILVSDYAQTRVTSWINLESDPLGSGWQTLQGLNAIGSGGFFGLGLGFSRQKYGYVSQPQNDFIFTIICEELGFVGAFLVVFLFAMLIWRGIRIGQRAPDKFCALTVWGLTFKIALQVAMNIAVVTNMMPNTGISLPFFSTGGSSLMIQIFEIGIILLISRFSTQKK